MSSTSKRGRPVAVYRPKTGGDPVVGLTRLKDGRWRASGPERFTFTEPDERLAIAKYLQWKERRHASSHGVLRVHSDAYSARIDLCRRTVAAGGSLQADIAVSEGEPTSYAVRDHTLNAAQWAWLRQQLITRRQWVAQMVGVEQVAYLPELNKPIPSPTLSEVGKTYTDRSDITQKETQKVGTTWQGFCRDAGVQTLRDLTPEAVAAWGAAVKKQGLSPRSPSTIGSTGSRRS